MYRREFNGRVLSFGHAGILYQRSFVMYDRESESLWVHVTGRAEWGPMKGSQLTFMPSTVTTWAAWKSAYPHSLVLPGHRRGGFMGNYKGIRGSRDIGLAVVVRFKGKLYPFRELESTPLVNDRFNGEELVVFYSTERGTATAWNRRLDGRTLRFRRSPKRDARGHWLLQDEQTGSLWSWLTGEAESGELKGRKLDPLLYNPILNGRFRAFYSDGVVYRG